MGDIRFERAYRQVAEAEDRSAAILALSDEEIIAALAAAHRDDPYLANVLASEAMNRARRKETLLSTAAEGLCAISLDGRLLMMNPAGERILGYAEGELVGRQFHDEVHRNPQGHPHPYEECAVRVHIFEGGETIFNSETEMYARADGSLFPVAYTAAPIIRDGDVEGAVIVFRDITERKRTEEALRESESRKAGILAAALDCIITIDATSRIVEWNPAAERIFGYSREEVVGRDMAEIVIPERFRDAHHRGIAHYLRTGVGPLVGTRVEVPALRRDGTEFPAELAIVPTQNDGKLLFSGYLRDITERQRAEEALRESEERYRALYDASPVMYVIVDEMGTILSGNEYGARYLGYEVHEILGRPVEDLYHPGDRESVRVARTMYLEHAGDGLAANLEVRKLHRDGTLVWVREAMCAIPWTGGRTAILSICVDITERRRADETRRRLAAIVEASEDAILSETPTGRILDWNPAAERMFGYTADEIVGRSVIDLIPPPLVDQMRALKARAARGERVPPFESERICKDGTRLHVSVTLSAVPDESGRVEMISTIYRDITAVVEATRERERLLARAQAARELAEAAARRSRFMAEASILLASSLDYETTVRRVADLAVPAIADWCAVHLLEEGDLRLVAVAHKDPARQNLALEAMRRSPTTLAMKVGVGAVVRTGQPRLVREVTDDLLRARAADAEHLGFLRALGMRSIVTVPLTAAGAPMGALTLVAAESMRRYDEEDLRLATDLATRVALAVENARLYRSREKSEARLRLAVEATALGTWDWDTRTGFTSTSERCTEILGYSPPHNVTQEEFFARVHPEDLPRVRQEIEKVLDPAAPDRLETQFRLLLPGGEVRWVLSMAQVTQRVADPGAAHGGRLTGALLDVTARRRSDEEALRLAASLEERVKERTRELTEANQELEAFTYLVSHDLKEPIRAIEAYLSALSQDYEANIPKEGIGMLHAAQQATGRLSVLLQGLLELGRVSRLGPIETYPVDAKEAIESIDCSARYHHVLAERGARLEVALPDGLIVRATRPALCQILGNLIVNAILHNPSSEPRVRVQGKRTEEGAHEILVEDDGPGFSDEAIARFNQARTPGAVPASHRLEGGFGLIIAARMVERLEGTMRLGRSPLGGAAVRILLPPVRDPASPRPRPR